MTTIIKRKKKDINRYINVIIFGPQKELTPDIIKTILKEKISSNAKILELGCDECKDAIFLLNKNCDVLAVNYSKTVIEKCKELSNFKYNEKIKQIYIINDILNEKFNFIYYIAVIHIFVNKVHRNKFYSFIYSHLNKNGIALIVSMGNRIKKYKSDVIKSFDDDEKIVVNNDEKINIDTTSCIIVN